VAIVHRSALPTDQFQPLPSLTPANIALPGVDETFARQVSDFIEQYRPALKALAKR
jgi:hypothetical protein